MGTIGSTYDVLMQADAFCDLVFTFADRDEIPALGQEVYADAFAVNPGGAFTIASVLTKMGLRVGWRTALGDDFFSRFVAERMEWCGLSLELTSAGGTPIITAAVSFPHDRLFISYADPQRVSTSVARLSVRDLDLYRPAALFTHGEVGTDVMRAARERGIKVFVDAWWNPDALRPDAVRALLKHADVFCPNLPEALQITGAPTACEAQEALSAWCESGAIKCGADGCIGWHGSGRYSVPAIPVSAVETTGAGDNFNAGMIYAMLRGYPYERCLQCANIAGGLSTLGLGGCAGEISASVVESWLARLEDVSEGEPA